MKKNHVYSCGLIISFSFLIIPITSLIEVQSCKPSGISKGQKPPPSCEIEGNLCCVEGKFYPTYRCSPLVSNRTRAILTLDSFEKGGDGKGPSKCEKKYYSNNTPVVALSTGWFDNKHRCLKNITIFANGQSAKAMVVDECDSSIGCDSLHNYQPPCRNNIVVASQAVWKALKVPMSQWGEIDILWADD